MLTHAYPYKLVGKTNLAICNHQVDNPFYLWPDACFCKQWKEYVWSHGLNVVLRPGVIKQHKYFPRRAPSLVPCMRPPGIWEAGLSVSKGWGNPWPLLLGRFHGCLLRSCLITLKLSWIWNRFGSPDSLCYQASFTGTGSRQQSQSRPS